MIVRWMGQRAWWAVAALGGLAVTSCGRVEGTTQMPAQQSTLAAEVDWLYYFVFWASVIAFIGIVGTMVLFVIRYHRSRVERSVPTGEGHTKLEVFWTFAPLILLAFLFHWGFQGFMRGVVAPADSPQVRVRASQWQWEFEYPNGAVEVNVLRVPVGQPVKLTLSSQDVIHSFFAPTFRVKRDAVPGMYTSLWFEAIERTEPELRDGEGVTCESDADCSEGYGCVTGICTQFVQVFCAEYCGAPHDTAGNVGHSAMLARILVVSREEYDAFIAEGPAMPADCEGQDNPAACWGAALYQQNGCASCHFTDGELQMPAPNFRGLFGRAETMSDGVEVAVDANYIRESILTPQARVVRGYETIVMPPFRLSDTQIDALIAYIESLEATP